MMKKAERVAKKVWNLVDRFLRYMTYESEDISFEERVKLQSRLTAQYY